MAKEWNTSKWPRRQPPEDPGDFDDGSPDGLTLSGDDLLEQNRHREYVRGRKYEVFVPSPFARNRTAKSKAEPLLRERYFVRWEMRDGARWPIFATEEEWLEIRLAEQTAEQDARLREVAKQQHNGAVVEENGEFLTTAQIAKRLNRVGDEAAVDRMLRRSKKVNSQGRGAKRRWERASVERWIEETKERPGTAKDYFNPDY